MKCKEIERHKSLFQRLNEELNSSFGRLGAIAYIIHVNRKYCLGHSLSESEIHKFYDAKQNLLFGEQFSYREYSPERKRAERKYSHAKKAYKDSDPTRDIPF